MYPKDLNPYHVYLQDEVRKARARRDLAIAQWILHVAGSFGRYSRTLVARIFPLEVRRDAAWVEYMEAKLRRHQPY